MPTPSERSWLRIEACIVDLLSALLGYWPQWKLYYEGWKDYESDL